MGVGCGLMWTQLRLCYSHLPLLYSCSWWSVIVEFIGDCTLLLGLSYMIPHGTNFRVRVSPRGRPAPMMTSTLSRYVFGGLLTAGSGYLIQSGNTVWAKDSGGSGEPSLSHHVPTRKQQLAKLRQTTSVKPLDVLVIGGGATGTGCAVDAATRWEALDGVSADRGGGSSHACARLYCTGASALPW